MKTLFHSNPILSFILITFLITFSFWFLPVLIPLSKDVALGTMLIGGCGPLLAGYIITVVNSKAKFIIGSKPIFILIFFSASIVLVLRLYLTNKGLSDVNGYMPTLSEVTPIGYLLFAVAFFILGLNASNATNDKLKENYLKSFLFEKSKLKWYLIGLSLFPFVALVSYYFGKIFGAETTDSLVNLAVIWLVGFFSTFFFFGGNEEFGWRGFFQKEMQKKYNPLITVFIISFLWSLWHLPLHYSGFYSTGGFIDLLPRFIFTIPLTIVITWLYNKSSYSILTVVLFHAMLNNYAKAIGSSEIISIILLILLSIFCIVDDKMWKKKSYHFVYKKEEIENASS